ncbi:Stp1/IreP family PP2C-type Ser/Thr phosphatase [soil metagenome]
MINPIENPDSTINGNFSYFTQAYSLQGKRPYQEDSFLISKKPGSCLVLVADGLGGHGHGDFASQLCCSIFKDKFSQFDILEDPEKFFIVTALEANKAILNKGEKEPEFRFCGTTVTGFLVIGNEFYLLNVGDSRVYSYDGFQNLSRFTKDHSVVQELLDEGEITEEMAFVHPERNLVTSSLGIPTDRIILSVTGPDQLEKDMVLLAFSDGVHDGLKDGQILSVIQKNTKDLAQALVEEAFEAGSRDNITACLLSLNSKYDS